MSHHPYRVELAERVLEEFIYVLLRVLPYFDGLIISLFVGKSASLILLLYLERLSFSLFDYRALVFREIHIEYARRYCAESRVLVSLSLYLIKYLARCGSALELETLVDYFRKLFLSYSVLYLEIEHVLWIASVDESEILRYSLVEYYSTDRGLDDLALHNAVDLFFHPDVYLCL